jgi:hypothetical protein
MSRQRKPEHTSIREDALEDPKHDQSSEPFMFQMKSRQASISAAELLSMTPQPFHGYMMKKDNGWLAYLLPCWMPAWKKRFFVVCGNYLFRFEDEEGEKPKGVPIPLDGCMITEIGENKFVVNCIRKTYCLQAADTDDLRKWIKAIKTRKLEAIRENMGHVEVNQKIFVRIRDIHVVDVL